MSSFDSRQITIRSETPKAERLFRAAISAYCALTRPSRRDMAQLEDLTLPLANAVSVECLRYVAAALAETRWAPPALVRLLADQRIDVAAPLLIRSGALTDIDLISMISRHGQPHAEAISRRAGLSAAVSEVIARLQPTPKQPDRKAMTPDPSPALAPPEPQSPAEQVENVRRRLRAMMRPAAQEPLVRLDVMSGFAAYQKLRETALTGHNAFFLTALADTLGIDFDTVRRMLGTSSYIPLLTALRALDLDDEQAYLITAAVYPSQFPHPEAIRLFLTRYAVMHHDIAVERVRTWTLETISAGMGPVSLGRPVHFDERPARAPANASFKAQRSG